MNYEPGHTYYRIPYNSPLNFLPLVFVLPEDLISRFPTLRKIPRCMSEISASQDIINLLKEQSFLDEILDGIAMLVFPHFGFNGWKEDYSENFTPWKMAYALPIWSELIERETGWGLNAMFKMKPRSRIPFWNSEFVRKLFERIVKQVLITQNWQAFFDVYRELPCEEDFEPKNSHVRIDFLRKWYHTRSTRVQMISLESLTEDLENNTIEIIPDLSENVEEKVLTKDFADRFMTSLSSKDRNILQLRCDGLTYEAIAKQLGYKNHTGVLKRMEIIKTKFLEYEKSI